MCEAKVYIGEGDEAQKVMENVALVRPEPESGAYLLVNILGEQKLVQGHIEEVNFLKHTVRIGPVQ